MRRLLRTFELVVMFMLVSFAPIDALACPRLMSSETIVPQPGLVSFATVDVSDWSYEDYDNCYYTCSDGLTYVVTTTRPACCNTHLSGFWCPPGEVLNPQAMGWGGTYHILESC